MDKKRSLLNVTISIVFKVILLFTSLIVRRVLIKYLGNDINGLNSLYLSVIGFLSVAELGIGTAIAFNMYKPIVCGDDKKVSALYNFYKKLYFIIGIVILLAGLAIMPIIPFLAADYSELNVNVYLTFGLILISTVLTYFYSAKISLINAYKNNYVTTLITSGGILLQDILQIIVLIVFRSFPLFLICRIISCAVQWIATEIYTFKKHKGIISSSEKIDKESKHEVSKSIRAMFMHKIGGVLVNSADSIIISAFIGVVALGKFSNYSTIVIALGGILGLFFTPLTSIIGHLCVKESKEDALKYFKFFYMLNFILGSIFYLGYFAIIDDLIPILFGEGLLLKRNISFVITLNYFIQFMRQSVLLFRDATGTFYNDRWKPLVEGLFNVFLSILFVVVFPEEIKIVGVIVATIMTNLFICHIVEPYVLFKHGLSGSFKKYLVVNYFFIISFAFMTLLMYFLTGLIQNGPLGLLIKGTISVLISGSISFIFALFNKDFLYYFSSLFKRKANLKHGND